MLENYLRGGKARRTWQLIWFGGCVFGIAVPFLGLLSGLFEASGWLVFAATAVLGYSMVGLTLFWMARLPEGVRGWRLGLMLVPCLGWLWVQLELIGLVWRLPEEMTPFRKIPFALFATLTLILPILAQWLLFADGNWPDWGVYFFGMLFWTAALFFFSGVFDRWADNRQPNPVSLRKRRRQLILVAATVLIPFVLYGAWFAYETSRCSSLEERWKELSVAESRGIPTLDPFFEGLDCDIYPYPLGAAIEPDDAFLAFCEPRLKAAEAFAEQFTPWLESAEPGSLTDRRLYRWLILYYQYSGRAALLNGDRENFRLAWKRLSRLVELDYHHLEFSSAGLADLLERSELDLFDADELAELSGTLEAAERRNVAAWREQLCWFMGYFSVTPIAHLGVWYYRDCWAWARKLRADVMEAYLLVYEHAEADLPQRFSRSSGIMFPTAEAGYLEGLMRQLDEHIEQLRLLRVRIALEQYRRRHGRWPVDAAELGTALPPSRLYGTPPAWDEAAGTVAYPRP